MELHPRGDDIPLLSPSSIWKEFRISRVEKGVKLSARGCVGRMFQEFRNELILTQKKNDHCYV